MTAKQMEKVNIQSHSEVVYKGYDITKYPTTKFEVRREHKYMGCFDQLAQAKDYIDRHVN